MKIPVISLMTVAVTGVLVTLTMKRNNKFQLNANEIKTLVFSHPLVHRPPKVHPLKAGPLD